MEETNSTTQTLTKTNHDAKSELDKFKLFYEFDVAAKDVHAQIKRQAERHTSGR